MRSSKRKPRKQVQIEIVGLAHKAYALGKTAEGLVVFTKHVVPGDQALVELTRKRNGVWLANVKELLHQSKDRVEPKCKHFGICGGCSLQNLSYDAQLIQKEKIVQDAITRIGKLKPKLFEPILAADPIFYYRNKLEFTFSELRWKTQEEMNSEEFSTPALGFHRPESYHKVVDITECHLQWTKTNEIRNWLKAYALEHDLSFYNVKEHKGWLRNVFFRTNRQGQIMMCLSVSNQNDEPLFALLNAIQRQFPELCSIFYTINTKLNDAWADLELKHFYGEKVLRENLDHAVFEIGPKSFFQTNTSQAERLYKLVAEYAELKGTECVYDLYCGVGSIGIFLAQSCKTIIGVEEIPEAIEDAKRNAQLNQFNHCHFYTGDAKMVLTEEFRSKNPSPDVVILDPPRTGLHADVIQQVLQMNAQKIIYVSCNPATQARDLALLNEAYELAKLRAVDMFPQTNHIESVAQLIKR